MWQRILFLSARQVVFFLPLNKPVRCDNLASAAKLLTELFEKRGTARLATSLVLSGWSPVGVACCNHSPRGYTWRMCSAQSRDAAPPSKEESQKIIAVLNAVIFTQAFTGDALLRSSGLQRSPREQLYSWIVTLLEKHFE